VKDDELGRNFVYDIRAAGVQRKPATTGPSTARSYIMVTPDGERAMNVSRRRQDLRPADIDEGRWRRCSRTSKAIYGIRRRLRRPSSSCGHRHKAVARRVVVGRLLRRPLSCEFLDLIRKGIVDIVFANERELHSLYETADFDTAVKALRGRPSSRW
jgi:adenosine kinase